MAKNSLDLLLQGYKDLDEEFKMNRSGVDPAGLMKIGAICMVVDELKVINGTLEGVREDLDVLTRCVKNR